MIPLTASPYEQNPIRTLGGIGDWWVDPAGSDSNDGQSATTVGGTTHGPWATIEKANSVLSPNGARWKLQQDTTVHVAAGNYGALQLYPEENGFNFVVDCAQTSTGPLVINAPINTAAPATRGRITLASGTGLVNKLKLRCTAGSKVGAVAYSNGRNSATDTFVMNWYDPSVDGPVNLAAADTIVQDTLGVTFAAVVCQKLGADPAAINAGGSYQIKRAKVTRGVAIPGIYGGGNTPVLQRAPTLFECEIGATIWTGVWHFIACRTPTGFGVGDGIINMSGCAVQGLVNVFERSLLRIRNSCAFDGAGVLVQGRASIFWTGSTGCEFENGTAGIDAIDLAATCAGSIGPAIQLWGVTGTWRNGLRVRAGVTLTYDTVPSILATVETELAGANITYADWGTAAAQNAARAAFIVQSS
jgi:hypothetical protein